MTSVSKNVFMDKFADRVNKYNIAYHSAQLKWSLLTQSQANILTLINKIILKLLNMKLVIM